MNDQFLLALYEVAITVRISWQAHSLSTAGSNGSNKLMPRRQLLASGRETDACSGNIAKHHHAALLAEYLEAANLGLCPACATRDSRRAAALIDRPDAKELSMERILRNCGLCDVHGFLLTAKKATSEGGETENRQRLSKHSLVEFSFALALPDHQAETVQLMTRSGDSKETGQMLMKMSVRSGDYALAIRYRCVGLGMDTDKWRLVVADAEVRRQRHRAILLALRDGLLSPDGAMTATMLPHLTGMRGALVQRLGVGRAPLYSALEEDFVVRLSALQSETCLVSAFETVDAFNEQINTLIERSCPSLPAAVHLTSPGEKREEGQ